MFNQVPFGTFLENQAFCLWQVSISLLSQSALETSLLSVLFSRNETTQGRERVKAHRKTWPCPGGIYGCCVAQTESMGYGDPFLYHFLLSHSIFNKKLHESEVFYYEEITTAEGNVSHCHSCQHPQATCNILPQHYKEEADISSR